MSSQKARRKRTMRTRLEQKDTNRYWAQRARMREAEPPEPVLPRVPEWVWLVVLVVVFLALRALFGDTAQMMGL